VVRAAVDERERWQQTIRALVTTVRLEVNGGATVKRAVCHARRAR